MGLIANQMAADLFFKIKEKLKGKKEEKKQQKEKDDKKEHQSAPVIER